MNLSFLPAVDATLNAIAATLLVMGLVYIKKGNIKAHSRCMISAFVVSCLFLICYVTHHIWRSIYIGGTHTKFYGPDAARYFYYTILISHILLAMTVPFLATIQLYLGLKRYDRIHKKFGRVVWPVWMYVSVTGVVIYVMLYHLNAHVAGA